MTAPDIAFDRIRPHGGSRHGGFEELCCQLASLESGNGQFVRKGLGPDAGVECIVRNPSGSEVGWQTKYFFKLGDAQIGQLNDSIATAVASHPKLTGYIVCLPFDLRDERHLKTKSERQRWTAWVKKWTRARRTGKKRRSLKIELWDRNTLVRKLTSPDPQCAGRLLYWFHELLLTPEWFRQKFDGARKNLGKRYTPETNVELPIRRTLFFIGRDPAIAAELASLRSSIAGRSPPAVSRLRAFADGLKMPDLSSGLAAAISNLFAAIGDSVPTAGYPWPLKAWLSALAVTATQVRKAMDSVLDQEEHARINDARTAKEAAYTALYQLYDSLSELQMALLRDDAWQLVNHRRLLIYGAAGTGKSHLLADAAQHQLDHQSPALLVLGESLIDDDIWTQLRKQMDLEAHTIEATLGAIDAAAQASNARALILVDAINERNGLDVWPPRLRGFLESVERFPHIALVLSCRTTYLEHLVPDSISSDELYRVEHRGYGAHTVEAVGAYFAAYDIEWHGAPSVTKEFENPLFLRVLCEALRAQGARELPRGMRGVTAIFSYYIDALAKSLTSSMKLDRYARIIQRAIEALGAEMTNRKQSALPASDVRGLFEAIHPSNGASQQSLLVQLEHEGLLTVEIELTEDGSTRTIVRFTFERLSDHVMALGLLDKHLDPAKPAAAFRTGGALQQYVDPQYAYRYAGLLEAFAVQLPERVKLELPEAVDADARAEEVTEAFFGSLLWRAPSAFTQNTLDIARDFSNRLGKDRVTDALVSIALEPDNGFNARHLHEKLRTLNMPERDQEWSSWLATTAADSPNVVETLIEWAADQSRKELDDDRAELAAITLSWFLSTSSRWVRDHATKALVNIFSTRLELAAKLVREFRDVNDLYVRERLLAAAYGCVLQGRTTKGLDSLIEATYDTVFSQGAPPIHVLLRDYACGIIDYGAFRSCKPPQVDQSRVRPPYVSPWPIGYAPEEALEQFNQDFNGHVLRDQIVGSTASGGDFGRYVIDNRVNAWSETPLVAKKPRTHREVYEDWLNAFEASATRVQRGALKKVLVAVSKAARHDATDATNTVDWLRFTDPARFAKSKGIASAKQERRETLRKVLKAEVEAEEKAFQLTLNDEAREHYRIAAKGYIRLSSEFHQQLLATFDVRWGERWVCQRAHEFGWTATRFAEFDRRHSSHDRMQHAVERIGKKYQWLALHELQARLSDNLIFLTSWNKEVTKYDGAWQLSARDIDPSLLIGRTQSAGWRNWGRTWWSPIAPELLHVSPEARLAWLHSSADVMNDTSLIDVKDPEGRRWLVLHGFRWSHQYGFVGDQKDLERQAHLWLSTLVVRKADLASLLRSLRKRDLQSDRDLPAFHLPDELFIGEHPWHRALAGRDDWFQPGDVEGINVRVRTTTGEYHTSAGSYDQSVTETISVQVPAPWLAEMLDARLSDGRALTYVNANGTVVFFDPAIALPGPHAALVDRELFLKRLDAQDLAPVWIIRSSKTAFGDQTRDGYGGEIRCTYIYTLKSNGFSVLRHRNESKPTRAQLRALLGHGTAVSAQRKVTRKRASQNRAKPNR